MTLAPDRTATVAQLRDRSGALLKLPAGRWLERVDSVDREVLRYATGPVLDLGCGPGRHSEALAEKGVIVVGIDLSGHAVALARSKGLAVLERSVFDSIPKAGQWGTALLLDGNIGIGGDPCALLTHTATLLRPGGRIIVEVEEATDIPDVREVRLEIDGNPGPWFAWAQVSPDGLQAVAQQSSLSLLDLWCVEGRWFGLLQTSAVA